MFAEQIRQAVMASPRAELQKVSASLWKAYAAGGVTEEEASALSALLESRKAVPAPGKALQRRLGSRPPTTASMARRRSWAAAGRLPPQLAARFTLAEQAVLAVVALAVEAGAGACCYPLDKIAALAGVGRTTAKNALREAHRLGLIRVEERRLSAWRNAPNRVTITDPAWLSWLRLRRKGGGVKSVTATSTKDHSRQGWRQRTLPESWGGSSKQGSPWPTAPAEPALRFFRSSRARGKEKRPGGR